MFAMKRNINEEDGEASKELLESLELVWNKNKTKVLGANFKNKRVFKRAPPKVVEEKGLPFVFSKDKKLRKTIGEFDKRYSKAVEEYKGTANGTIENTVRADYGLFVIPPDVVDDVRSETMDELEGFIDAAHDRIADLDITRINEGSQTDDVATITRDEVREILPTLTFDTTQKGQTPEQQVVALKPNIALWEGKAKEAVKQGKPERARIFGYVADTTRQKIDYIHLRNNKPPESKEGKIILRQNIRQNLKVRLERFKLWAKDNLGALSLGAISVAGIITTVAVSARGAIKVGAKATGRFARGLWNLGKKLGPVVGGILSIVGSILSAGATGLAILANNLWILAVALTYYLYTQWKNRKGKQQQ